MILRERFGIAAAISLICVAAIVLTGMAPAIADNTTTSSLPYSKTWGNSTGRTGCSATTWGKSDTTLGCSGANNNSKCLFIPCKYCIRTATP